jgi:hypothetical protein
MNVLVSRVEGSRLIVDGGEFDEQEVFAPTLDELVFANGARMNGVRFRGLRIKHGSFGAGRIPVTYAGCVFDDCRFVISSIGRATFINCKFTNCSIKGWLALNAEFLRCSFVAKLERVVFDARPSPQVVSELRRSVNRFEENDFTGSSFRDVAFRGGISLERDLLPKEVGGYFLPDARLAYSRIRDQLNRIDQSWVIELSAFIEVRLENCLQGQSNDYISPSDIRAAASHPSGSSMLQDLLDKVGERLA